MKTRAKSVKTYKIILLGDCQVGKTCIIERFVSQRFSTQEQPTIGIDFFSKTLPLHGHNYKLQLWDTAGQEKYMSLVPTYLRDPHAVLFVFDLNRTQSLSSIQKWMHLFREHQSRQALCFLCGNKSDLTKQVNKEKVEELMNKYKMTYFTVSARSGENIEEAFSTILGELVRKSKEKGAQDYPLLGGQDLESLPTEAKLESGTLKEQLPASKEAGSGCPC